MSENAADDPRRQVLSHMAARNETAPEETMTRLFLRKLLPPAVYAAVNQELRAKHLSLQLGVLFDAIPGFPLRLAAAKVYYIAALEPAMLFVKFFQTPIAREFFEAVDNNGWNTETQHVGIVFAWPNGTTMVLHNWPRSDETSERHKGYVRLVATTSKGAHPLLLTLEPVDSLIQAMERAGTCRIRPTT